VKAKLALSYDEKFDFLFTQLAVGGTAPAVRDHVKAIRLHRPMPGTAGYANVAAAPDDTDLSD
jgi:fructose-bisphosphate aldolase, class II